MDIPGFQICMLPLLKVLADGHQHSLNEAVDSVADQLQVPLEKRAQLRESGVNILYNTVAWAKTYLKQAGLLYYPVRGMMQITDEGRELLESGVQNIDIKILDRYPSFVEFKNRKGTKLTSAFNPDGSENLFFEFPEEDSDSFSGSPFLLKNKYGSSLPGHKPNSGTIADQALLPYMERSRLVPLMSTTPKMRCSRN